MHQPKPLIFLGISGVFVFGINYCRKSVETGQRTKAHSVQQVIRGQVGITHGHSQTGVPEDFLQVQDVSAVLDEMASKGMPQTMAGLTTRKVNRCSSQGATKRGNSLRTLAMPLPVLN